MAISFRLTCLVAGATALAGGCSTTRPTPGVTNATVIVREFPAESVGAVAPVQGTDYRIGPRDLLQLRILGNEDLGVDARVDNGGLVQLPLVGSVRAAGKTPAELNAELAELYERTYLKNPRVSLTVAEINSQNVVVDGSVRKPGVYPVIPGMTLSSALALAEGTTEYASLDNVAIFRTVDGQRMAAVFNIKDIRRGLYADPMIRASDTVVVGDAPLRRIFRDVISLAPFVAVFRPFGR